LSRTHLLSLINIDDPLKREFYLEVFCSEGGARAPCRAGTAQIATLNCAAAVSPRACAA